MQEMLMNSMAEGKGEVHSEAEVVVEAEGDQVENKGIIIVIIKATKTIFNVITAKNTGM